MSLVVCFHLSGRISKIYEFYGDSYAVVNIYILNKLGVTPLIFACPTAFYGNLSSSFAKNACMKEKNIDIM